MLRMLLSCEMSRLLARIARAYFIVRSSYVKMLESSD